MKDCGQRILGNTVLTLLMVSVILGIVVPFAIVTLLTVNPDITATREAVETVRALLETPAP